VIPEINRDKQFELLRWLLTSLDGQWLSKAAAVYGPAEASKLNGRVRSNLGRTEMKAMLSLLGKNRATNLSEAAEIVQAYLTIAYGERNFAGTFHPVRRDGQLARLQIEVSRFSALDTNKKAAQAGGERIEILSEIFWRAWFETLLPDEPIEISVQTGATGIDLITLTTAEALAEAEELSPIAAALQIPLEQSIPAPAQSLPLPFNQPTPVSEKPEGYPFTAGYLYRPDLEPAPIGYNELTQPPLPQSALPPDAPPILGATEPGAERNTGGSLNQRLSRLQRTEAKPEMLPPDAPPSLQNQEEVSAVPSRVLKLDPASGRPLFQGNIDEEVKRSVEKRKITQKSLPLMARLMLSKEARELMQQNVDEKPLAGLSLAIGVEANLQRLIMEDGTVREPAHVMDGSEGELQIVVGVRTYGSVGEVPPGRIRELLEQAVEEWTTSQGW